MDERYYVVRARSAQDLIELARHAAAALRTHEGWSPLADALDGAATQVAIDLAEPVLS